MKSTVLFEDDSINHDPGFGRGDGEGFDYGGGDGFGYSFGFGNQNGYGFGFNYTSIKDAGIGCHSGGGYSDGDGK